MRRIHRAQTELNMRLILILGLLTYGVAVATAAATGSSDKAENTDSSKKEDDASVATAAATGSSDKAENTDLSKKEDDASVVKTDAETIQGELLVKYPHRPPHDDDDDDDDDDSTDEPPTTIIPPTYRPRPHPVRPKPGKPHKPLKPFKPHKPGPAPPNYGHFPEYYPQAPYQPDYYPPPQYYYPPPPPPPPLPHYQPEYYPPAPVYYPPPPPPPPQPEYEWFTEYPFNGYQATYEFPPIFHQGCSNWNDHEEPSSHPPPPPKRTTKPLKYDEDDDDDDDDDEDDDDDNEIYHDYGYYRSRHAPKVNTLRGRPGTSGPKRLSGSPSRWGGIARSNLKQLPRTRKVVKTRTYG